MAGPGEHDVRLHRVGWRDMGWIVAMGLDPELIGVQYSRAEAPLQLVTAPLRALLGPFVPACTVWVDGRRAGYTGRAALSGNYEYVLRPWARSIGIGRWMIGEFLLHHRHGDKGRAFFVSSHNDRSRRALLWALGEIGWHEGTDFTVVPVRFGVQVRVRAG